MSYPFYEHLFEQIPERGYPRLIDPNARHWSFARVSGTAGTYGGSYDNQFDINSRIAARYGGEGKLTKVEDDITSRVEFRKRKNAGPIFNDMKRGDHAYFAYVARGFRKQQEVFIMQAIFHHMGVFMHFADVNEGEPVSAVKEISQTAKTQLSTLSLVAEVERDQITDRVETGVRTSHNRLMGEDGVLRGRAPSWTNSRRAYFPERVMLLRRIIAMLHEQGPNKIACILTNEKLKTFRHGEKTTKNKEWGGSTINKLVASRAVRGYLDLCRWVTPERDENGNLSPEDVARVKKVGKKKGKMRIVNQTRENYFVFPVQVFVTTDGVTLHQWEDWCWRDAPEGETYTVQYSNPQGVPVDADKRPLEGKLVDTDRKAPIMTERQLEVLRQIRKNRRTSAEYNGGGVTGMYVNLLRGLPYCAACDSPEDHTHCTRTVGRHYPWTVTPQGRFGSREEAIAAHAALTGHTIGYTTACEWVRYGRNGWSKEERHNVADGHDSKHHRYHNMICRRANRKGNCDNAGPFPYDVAERLVMVLVELTSLHNEWWRDPPEQAHIKRLKAEIKEAEGLRDGYNNQKNLKAVALATEMEVLIDDLTVQLRVYENPGYLAQVYCTPFLEALLADYRRMQVMPYGPERAEARRAINALLRRVIKGIALEYDREITIELMPANGRYVEFSFTDLGQYIGHRTREDTKTRDVVTDDPNVKVYLAELNQILNRWDLAVGLEPEAVDLADSAGDVSEIGFGDYQDQP